MNRSCTSAGPGLVLGSTRIIAHTSFACCHQVRLRRYPVPCRANKATEDKRQLGTLEDEIEKRRVMEDELRDPKNFLEYFLPRPIRLTFFGGAAVSCLLGVLLGASRLVQSPALEAAEGSGLTNLLVNLVGLVVFASLFVFDQKAAETRVARRKKIREAQIAFGDREVFVNENGEKMSRLKEVNDEWIVRRLERWGRRDRMPFLGPKKAALLQDLVVEKQPRVVFEVGTMAGYSSLMMSCVAPEGCRIITAEKDLVWFLVAKRFLWQASQGSRRTDRTKAKDMVDVRWGDASQLLQRLDINIKIDLLFLDGTPKEYLDYLKAAEPHLAPGALVVADNAGVFKEGGLRDYLQYVRTSPRYKSRYIESTLEWRDDVVDGMEVSQWEE